MDIDHVRNKLLAEEHFKRGEMAARRDQWSLAVEEFETAVRLEGGQPEYGRALEDARRELASRPVPLPRDRETILCSFGCNQPGVVWFECVEQYPELNRSSVSLVAACANHEGSRAWEWRRARHPEAVLTRKPR